MDYFDKKISNPIFEAEIENQLGKKILKTSYMADRLSGISMMGLVYIFENVPEQYIYNRYDHTISVAHLTFRLCKRLLIPKTETKLAILAALCHDLGHGPLSHSSEGYLIWKSGTQSGHQTSNHYKKIESMLQECEGDIPSDLLNAFGSLEALAKAAYYVTQGAMPRDWEEEEVQGAYLLKQIVPLFDAPFSPDVIDGDNRAFLSLSHKAKLGLSPFNPEAIIDAISTHEKMFVVDGIYGKNLIQQFVHLQGRFYSLIIQTKRLEAGEAMLARAIELAYKSRKTSIGFSNLTDQMVIEKMKKDPQSAKLWDDLENKRLYSTLSIKHPDIYEYVSRTYPLHNLNLEPFKASKRALEEWVAKQLKIDKEFVIAQVLQPLEWDENNVQFVGAHDFVSRKTRALKYEIKWSTSRGMPQARRLEVYIPS